MALIRTDHRRSTVGELREAPTETTGRQRLEKDLGRVLRGVWSFVAGDGDDFDRALRMARSLEHDEEVETEGTVLPDDSDGSSPDG